MTTDVKRWEHDTIEGPNISCMNESATGEWVEYTDYATAIAERDAAQQEVRRLAEENSLTLQEYLEASRKWRESRAELAQLRGGNDAGPTMVEMLDKCIADRDALAAAQKFKAWVHSFLDSKGVPHDPDPEGNAKHGCRISGRMQWVFDLCDEWKHLAKTGTDALKRQQEQIITLERKHAEALALLRRWLADGPAKTQYDTEKFLDAEAKAEAKGGR